MASSGGANNSGDDETLIASLEHLLPIPPPPPNFPPPDICITPPPPPGSPPPVDRTFPQQQKNSLLNMPREPRATPQSSPIKEEQNQRLGQMITAENVQKGLLEQEDLDAYSDATDVFEEDVEAILFAEEEEDRHKGYTDCLTETHLDSTEYPYPAYLSKLSTEFKERSVFGGNPEDFIYCNNLLVNPNQLKLLDTRTAAVEREKLEQVRKAAALKAKEERRRRRQERLAEALEPPAKKIKISEATLKALESKTLVSLSKPKSTTNTSRKRSRKKPAPATPTSSKLPSDPSTAKKARSKPASSKITGKSNSKVVIVPGTKKKTTASSNRTLKTTTTKPKGKTKAADTPIKTPNPVKKGKALHGAQSSKETKGNTDMKKNHSETKDSKGNASSSSSSESSSSSSSSSTSSPSSSGSSGSSSSSDDEA